ncbi:TPR-like protein [Rickenella mellea]|uniref:ER membrane protein complex subunit 2 n=1 Tax=Rickenella mellea TaxID=50990 RepID=A0A4Y7QL91_9AGAM|nr:TPR-like protein [Rickenella mellea]
MSKELAVALQKLATYRAQNSRASQQTFEQGVTVLKHNALWKQGDDGWAFLEQLTLASLDVGKPDVADRCISLLTQKFPGSPRVECLTGIRLEATETPEVALKYYDDMLSIEESNAALWKRKISVLRRMGQINRAVEELSSYLDTFYTDVEGWLELANIYTSCNQYTLALQALQHTLLLAPQNSFYALQAAETAYTAGDIPLAIKMFLTVTDMSDDSDSPADSIPEGITVRSWYGVKLCTRNLLKDSRTTSVSPSQTPVPEHVKLLDELATERLLTAYSSGNGPVNGREVLVKWLEAK